MLTVNVRPGDFLPYLLRVDGDPDGALVPVHQEGDGDISTSRGCHRAQN